MKPENTDEFITLGAALISAIKKGAIPMPELIQEGQKSGIQQGAVATK